MLSLLSYLITTSLKDYLQKFLFTSTSHLDIIKKIKCILKGKKKKKIKETEQASEPGMAGVLI